MSWRLLPATLISLCLASAAQAAITVSDSADPGSPFSAGVITNFNVYGDQMDGLHVTATINNLITSTTYSETVGFLHTATVGQGAASGTGWRLVETGHTYGTMGNGWTLSLDDYLVMTHLKLQGGTFGNTIFDVRNSGRTTAGSLTPGASDPSSVGTLGSEKGWTFELFANPDF